LVIIVKINADIKEIIGCLFPAHIKGSCNAQWPFDVVGHEFVYAIGISWHNKFSVNGITGFARIVIPNGQVEKLLADIAQGLVEKHSDCTQGVGRFIQPEPVGKL
jgi:hypothetical protein